MSSKKEPTRFPKGEGSGRGGGPSSGPRKEGFGTVQVTRAELMDVNFTAKNRALLADPAAWELADED